MKVVPPVEKWIDGTLNIGQIVEVNIEDLLNRSPIKINNPILQKELSGKSYFNYGSRRIHWWRDCTSGVSL